MTGKFSNASKEIPSEPDLRSLPSSTGLCNRRHALLAIVVMAVLLVLVMFLEGYQNLLGVTPFSPVGFLGAFLMLGGLAVAYRRVWVDWEV